MKGLKRFLLGCVLLIIVLGGFFGWISPDPQIANQNKKSDYLDMHVHVACLDEEKYGCYIHSTLKENIRFPFFLEAMGVTEEEVKEFGGELIVERLAAKINDSKRVSGAVILAMDGAIQSGGLDKEKTQIYVPNEFVYEQAQKYKNLYFGASINPYRRNSIQELEKVKAQGALLIKWIPAIMHIDPADVRIRPFYEKMAELGIPLLTHVGQERSFATAKDELGDPRKLSLPLSLGVTVIAAHIGTTGEYDNVPSFDRMIPMFKNYKNLYADISSLTQVNKLDYLVNALKVDGLAERLIYGSDWPLQMTFLVNPLYHSDHISFNAVKALYHITNTWDRDVYLKEALGVPEVIFLNSRRLLMK